MKLLRLLLPLVLPASAFWFSGCASGGYPTYTPPTDGPVAKIKFTTAGTHIGAFIYDDETLKNPRWVAGGDEWVIVPADKPLVVYRGFSGGALFGVLKRESEFLVSFIPEAGKHYEMQYGHGMPLSVLRLMPLTPDGKRIMSDNPLLDPKGKRVGTLPVFLPLTDVKPPVNEWKRVDDYSTKR